MAWDPPSTFSAGAVLTAAQMNQIRDSLRYLKGLDGAISLDAALTSPSMTNPTLQDSASTMRCRPFYATSIGASAVTIIADGSGDVTQGIAVTGIILESAGGSGAISVGIKPGAVGTVYNDGVDICNVTVSVGGAVTIARSAGSSTFTVGLWLTWI